jgi:hypothetical protein
MTRHVAEPIDQRSSEAAAVARNLERLAWLMDRAIRIPGTKITLGLDALLGLVPLGGDALTGVVQLGLVLVALRYYRVPRVVAARMLGNVLFDTAVGAIPLLGDLFDVAFKANTRNLQLLEPFRAGGRIEQVRPTFARTSHGAAAQRQFSTIDVEMRRTIWRYVIPIAAILLLALALMIVGLVAVVRWIAAAS